MTTKRTTGFVPQMEGTSGTRKNVTVPFNNIADPGCYYGHETGWLYRIPNDILAMGHSPLVNIVSNEEHLVTKIAEDPWLPLNKAREICSNADFAVNF